MPQNDALARRLLEHPRIVLDAHGTATDALLIEGSEILATGADARQRGRDAEHVRPEAACLMPALHDAHCHLWGLGLRQGVVDLGDASSPEGVYQILAQAQAGPHGWLLARDWDQHHFAPGLGLDRLELDRHTGSTPAMLWRVDRHALMVNSAALRRAGLPLEGSGLLVDQDMDPILDVVPEPSIEEDAAVYQHSARMLRSYGIACAHAAWVSAPALEMLRRLHRRQALPLRMVAMLDVDDPKRPDWLAEGPYHDSEGWLQAKTFKFFADGALGSQGALLRDPYRDGTRGAPIHDAPMLRELIPDLLAGGWQVAVHAIGDAAADHVIEAFALAEEATRRATRPRLEHAQMLSDEAIARMDALGIIASIQPVHMRSDATWAHRVLDDDQLRRLFRWADLRGRCRLAAGSDYPIEDPNPWRGIATALDRLDAKGRSFFPEQRLERSDILEAYTSGAAWAAQLDHLVGHLAPGMRADIAALDRDPWLDPVDTLASTRATALWIDGQSVDLG